MSRLVCRSGSLLYNGGVSWSMVCSTHWLWRSYRQRREALGAAKLLMPRMGCPQVTFTLLLKAVGQVRDIGSEYRD